MSPLELPVPCRERGPEDGTEEVLCLEHCPPTKRLKSNPCNSSKEQRMEEDQTRGTGLWCEQCVGS